MSPPISSTSTEATFGEGVLMLTYRGHPATSAITVCKMGSEGFPQTLLGFGKSIHVHKVHVYEVYAHEVHAYAVHAHKVHAYDVHAREVHICEMHV